MAAQAGVESLHDFSYLAEEDLADIGLGPQEAARAAVWCRRYRSAARLSLSPLGGAWGRGGRGARPRKQRQRALRTVRAVRIRDDARMRTCLAGLSVVLTPPFAL